MRYLRKVNCPSLGIKVALEDQAYALRLYNKLRKLGYHDAEILDFFVDEEKKVDTDDHDFHNLMIKVVKKSDLA